MEILYAFCTLDVFRMNCHFGKYIVWMKSKMVDKNQLECVVM